MATRDGTLAAAKAVVRQFVADGQALRAVKTLFIMSSGIALAFLTNLVLANMLGAAEYGRYIFAISVVTIAAFGVKLGLDVAAVRLLPQYRARAQWALVQGFVRVSAGAIAVVAVSVAGILAAAYAGFYVPENDPEQKLPVLFYALPLLALNALILLHGAYLQAWDRFPWSEAVQNIGRPFLFLGVIFFTYAIMPRTAVAFVLTFAGVTAVVLLSIVLLARQTLGKQVTRAVPQYRTAEWFRISIPLMFVGGATVIMNQIDVIVVGTLLPAAEVGAYAAAARLSFLLELGALAANSLAAPAYSSLFAANDTATLQHRASQAAVIGLLVALPPLALFIMFPEWILQLFGDEFVIGAGCLTILAIGRLFSVLANAGGYLLLLSGHERTLMMALVVAIAVNIVANMVFIYYFGLIGAAMGTALSVLVSAIGIIWGCRRKVGIAPTVLAALRPAA